MKLLVGSLVVPIGMRAAQARMRDRIAMIDDFSGKDLTSRLGTRWRGISDQVMGGISEASVIRDVIDGRPCLRLSGDVRLDNNGGFIQAALDLAPAGSTFDASAYSGVRLVVRGNGEPYAVHLRTAATLRPWQSYRAQFIAGPDWKTVDLDFQAFAPFRLAVPLDVAELRRIAVVAIGRAFHADVAVAELSFYAES